MQQNLIAFFRHAFLRHGPRRFAVMQPQTADRKYDDFPGPLNDRQIAAHLEGHAAYAVPTAQDGLASFLPLDIDAGGLDAARALLDAAQARGLWAFAQVDEARGRGYVWIPFTDLTNAARLHQLGQQLLAEVQTPGTPTSGWKIENRATNEDTRLPFARHAWSGRRGMLLYSVTSDQCTVFSDPAVQNLDAPDYIETLTRFIGIYHENPVDLLPPPPPTAGARSNTAPAPRSRQERPSGQGITIASYNAATDLVTLLEGYGARRARGQGARLYFCPFHPDDHASLQVSREGQHCRCYSTGSGCPLAEHRQDAFNIFCTGERLTTAQALRRLNGLPDDPTPPQPPAPRPPRPRPTPGQSPPKMAQESPSAQKPSSPACRTPNAAVRPSQSQPEALPQPPDDTPQAALPKSARRVLAYLKEQKGDYCRGKWHLARVLDIDPRTVQRSLRRLEAEGLIERFERGREGQTDIYRVTPAHRRSTERITDALTEGNAHEAKRKEEGTAHEAKRRAAQLKRVNPNTPTHAPDPHEGRQLPPTITQILHATESLEAERGGSPAPATVEAQAIPVEDAHHGPAGAVAYLDGAAWVPPQAEEWYSALLRAIAPAIPEEPPEQIVLVPVSASPVPPAEAGAGSPAPPRQKRQRRSAAPADTAKLQGQIIAAERKAAKLERGSARERRQAAAIRQHAEQLRRRQARAEAEREATWYTADECDQWLAAYAETSPAPPSSSF